MSFFFFLRWRQKNKKLKAKSLKETHKRDVNKEEGSRNI